MYYILFTNAVNQTTCERKVCYYFYKYTFFVSDNKTYEKKAIDLHVNCAWDLSMAVLLLLLLLFFFWSHTCTDIWNMLLFSALSVFTCENNLISFQNKLLYHLCGQKTKTKPGNKEFDPVHSSFRLFPSGEGSQRGLDSEPTADMMANIVVCVV